MLEPENAIKCSENRQIQAKVVNKNYGTAKKNLVQVERYSKEKQIFRPSINGPSLLKNKSFMEVINN